MDNAVIVALIALGGTSVGAGLAGAVQWATARSSRLSNRENLQTQLGESRRIRLWEARTELYARCIGAASDWHGANLDLSGVDLDSHKGSVKTLAEAAEAAPEAARALTAMYSLRPLSAEVDLLADTDVRAAWRGVECSLRAEMRAAISGEPEGPSFGEALGVAIRVMRHELVRGEAHHVFGGSPDQPT